MCAYVLPRHRSRSRDSRGFDDFKNSCFLLFRKSAWSIKSCSHFSRQIKMFEMFQITKNSTFRNSKITFFRSKSMTKYFWTSGIKIHGFENTCLTYIPIQRPEIFILGSKFSEIFRPTFLTKTRNFNSKMKISPKICWMVKAKWKKTEHRTFPG